MRDFKSVKQGAGARFRRSCDHERGRSRSCPPSTSAKADGNVLKNPQTRRARRTEVAILRVVNTLLVIHPLDQLGNHAVQIRIALAVPVRRQIHRHPVEKRREIGAVIEVESAQEILVRLPAAGVLGDDHAGDGLQNFPRPEQGTGLQLRGADRALRRRIGQSKQAVAAT